MYINNGPRLWLTADGDVVEDGDPRAATLLVGEGGQLSDEEADRHGLRGRKAKQATPNKAKAGPAENKATEPTEDEIVFEPAPAFEQALQEETEPKTKKGKS